MNQLPVISCAAYLDPCNKSIKNILNFFYFSISIQWVCVRPFLQKLWKNLQWNQKIVKMGCMEDLFPLDLPPVITRKTFMPIDTTIQQLLKDSCEDFYICCDNGKAEF